MRASAATTALPAAASLLAADSEFRPIELAVPAPARCAEFVRHANTIAAVPEAIAIELRRGAWQLSVPSASSTTDDFTAWLRELSSGLLK